MRHSLQTWSAWWPREVIAPWVELAMSLVNMFVITFKQSPLRADATIQFKKLKTFDCYRQYYSKREEAQSIFQRELQKKSSNGFAGFIDVSCARSQSCFISKASNIT